LLPATGIAGGASYLDGEALVLSALIFGAEPAALAGRLRAEHFADPLRLAIAHAALKLIGEHGRADYDRVGELVRVEGQHPSDVVAAELRTLADMTPLLADKTGVMLRVEDLIDRAASMELWKACVDGKAALDNGGSPATVLERFAEILARQSSGEVSTAVGCVVVRLSDVEPQQVRWLWPGRIPAGKLTLVAGDPGLGKSTMTLDIAARVSRGIPFHDCRDIPNPAGDVLILSAEDDPADTIRPRLDAAGADAARVHWIEGVRRIGEHGVGQFSLDTDMPHLQRAIQKANAPRLVIVDPISAYMGWRTDSHRNTDVRALLAPLAALAAKHGVAVLAITHLNKGSGGKAIYRATGSLAFAAAARAVWLVVADANDRARRLLLPAKMNLATDPTGLAFTIRGSVIHWEAEPVSMTADEALASELENEDDRASRLDAGDWLEAALDNGSLPAKEVLRQAKANGITPSALRRAKTERDVESFKISYAAKEWYWRLPGDTRPPVLVTDGDESQGAQGAQGAQGHVLGILSALSALGGALTEGPASGEEAAE
jgi:hypothetical protein